MKKKAVVLIIFALLIIGVGVFLFLNGGEKKYKIEFSGASGIENLELKEGNYLKKPDDPVKEGYTFTGWYSNGVLFDFSKPIEGNVKLEARWVEALTSDVYVITFNSDGGTKIETQNVNGNGKVTKPVDPVKDGYSFVEWQLDEMTYDFTTKVTKAITLKAVWKMAGKVSITFNTDGGNVVKTQIISENSSVTKPANPIKSGYKFVSWQLNGSDYDFSEKVSSDIELKATWEKLETNTVTFNSDGGSAVKTQIVETGTLTVKPVNPTKSGYRFVSWQLNGTNYTFTTKVTKDITLKATWKKIETNTVTFDSNGGTTVKALTVEKDTVATKPANPTKSGYKFVSWQLNGVDYNFATKVTGNITLKATWRDLNKYTVTFDSTGGTTVESKQITEGEKVTKPTNPTKSGYKFASWQLSGTNYNFDKAVIGNITLKATWTQNTYTIEWQDQEGGNALSPQKIVKVYENGTQISIQDFYYNKVADISSTSKTVIMTKKYAPLYYVADAEIPNIKSIKLVGGGMVSVASVTYVN